MLRRLGLQSPQWAARGPPDDIVSPAAQVAQQCGAGPNRRRSQPGVLHLIHPSGGIHPAGSAFCRRGGGSEGGPSGGSGPAPGGSGPAPGDTRGDVFRDRRRRVPQSVTSTSPVRSRTVVSGIWPGTLAGSSISAGSPLAGGAARRRFGGGALTRGRSRPGGRVGAAPAHSGASGQAAAAPGTVAAGDFWALGRRVRRGFAWLERARSAMARAKL